MAHLASGGIGLVLAGLAILVGHPIVGAIMVLLSIVGPVFVKAGFLTTGICVALVGYGAYGAIALYAPYLQIVPQVSKVALSLIGAFFGVNWVLRNKLPGAAPKFALLFVAFCAVATLVASQQGAGFALQSGLQLVAPMLIAFAVAGTVASGTRIESRNAMRLALLMSLLLVVIGNATMSLRQAIGGFTSREISQAHAGVSTYGVGDAIRTMGLMPTNQDFGLLCACLAPGLLLAMIYAERKYKLWIGGAGGLLSIATLLSLTRTSLIALIISVLVALVLWGKGRVLIRLAKYSAIIAVIGVAVFQIISASGNERVIAATERAFTLTDLESDKSFNVRMDVVYPRAIEAMTMHPFGAGAGSAGPMSQERPELARFGEFITDNGFLMIGVQTGFIGMAAFVGMLISTTFWLARKRTMFSIGAATSILALLVAMITAQYWTLGAPMAVIAAWVGLGLSAPFHDKENAAPIPSLRYDPPAKL